MARKMQKSEVLGERLDIQDLDVTPLGKDPENPVKTGPKIKRVRKYIKERTEKVAADDSLFDDEENENDEEEEADPDDFQEPSILDEIKEEEEEEIELDMSKIKIYCTMTGKQNELSKLMDHIKKSKLFIAAAEKEFKQSVAIQDPRIFC